MYFIQKQSCSKGLLTHFCSMFPFHTPGVFRGYKMGTLCRNESSSDTEKTGSNTEFVYNARLYYRKFSCTSNIETLKSHTCIQLPHS